MTRHERDNGFIEFLSPNKRRKTEKGEMWPLFKTVPGEPVIFQLGTNDPE